MRRSTPSFGGCTKRRSATTISNPEQQKNRREHCLNILKTQEENKLTIAKEVYYESGSTTGKNDSLPEGLKKKLDKTAAFESELSEDELDKVAGGANSMEEYYDNLRALGWSEEDIMDEKLREEAYAECKKRGFWGNCDKFDEIYRELLIKHGLLPVC